MKKQILGIKIDDITIDRALNRVEEWLSKDVPASTAKRDEKHYIVTPNPEILVAAQDDPVLKKILNEADLSLPDGVGLKLSGKVKNTVPGTDLMERLVKVASEKGFAIGLLGGRDGVAKKCAECLKKKYPGLKVSFAENGGDINNEGDPSVASGDLRMTKGVDLLFVAFGPPKQEKWIANNLDKIPVKVAMGVGGAFDYLSGKVPRAPRWIRSLGLEWLFRAVLQPWRIKRQISLIKYLFLLTRSN